jgi:protein-tyrosine phosphatase
LIDVHCHVLPGLDDGAAAIDEAVEMCRRAVDAGVEMIVATPHVRDDYPTTREQMLDALELVRDAVGRLIRVLPGGEVSLSEMGRPIDELRGFGLGGNPDILLVETPYVGRPRHLEATFARLFAAGVRPVLAHPERNPEVQARPELLVPIVAAGVLVQVTAGSIAGTFGRQARRCADDLLDRDCVHLVASDAHDASDRPLGADVVRAAVGDELARWLTVDVPRAIVYRLPLPPRPARPSFSFRLRRQRSSS